MKAGALLLSVQLVSKVSTRSSHISSQEGSNSGRGKELKHEHDRKV